MPIRYNKNTGLYEEARGQSHDPEPYFLPHETAFHPDAVQEWAELHLRGARVMACRDLGGTANLNLVTTAGFIRTGWFIFTAIEIVWETIEKLRELSKKYFRKEPPTTATRLALSDRTNERREVPRSLGKDSGIRIPETGLNRATHSVIPSRDRASRDLDDVNAKSRDGHPADRYGNRRSDETGSYPDDGRNFRDTARHVRQQPALRSDLLERNAQLRPMGGPDEKPPPKDDPKKGRDPPKQDRGSNGDRGSKDDNRKGEPPQDGRPPKDAKGWYSERKR